MFAAFFSAIAPYTTYLTVIMGMTGGLVVGYATPKFWSKLTNAYNTVIAQANAEREHISAVVTAAERNLTVDFPGLVARIEALETQIKTLTH